MQRIFICLILVLSNLTLGVSPSQAANNYSVSWSVGNSTTAWPTFTRWPTGLSERQTVVGVFPKCTQLDSTDCIKSVAYQDSQSRWIEGKMESYFPVEIDRKTYPGKVVYKFTDTAYSENPIKTSALPKSARSSIWTFPGMEHSGGSKFLVTFTISRGGNEERLLSPTGTTQIAIVPISDSTQQITKSELDDRPSETAHTKLLCFYDPVAMKKYCTQREEFTSINPIRLVVNLKAHKDLFSINDWLTARNQNTEISSKKLNDGSEEITFQGIPISINSAESFRPATVENYVLGRKILNLVSASTQNPGFKPYEYDLNRTQCFNPDPNNYLTTTNPNCQGQADMTLNFGLSSEDASGYFILRELEKYYPVTPIDAATVWSFKTMNPVGADYLELRRCSSLNELSGVLSSNATVLVPSPPKWNKENDSLDYNLASTHLDTNGKVVTGFYELRVSTAVAKCLWGNDLSQAKVQIQIFSASDNGIQSVEVSNLEIKDGYISFKASGFHYSANEIKLKIIGAKNLQPSESTTSNQPASPTPAPTATVPIVTPTPKIALASPKKVVTITCAKGKLSKKVTALKPACPTGYKKK